MTAPGRITVAFQGERGAFSEEACVALYGHEAELVPSSSFDDVFEGVEASKVAFGVVPIENTVAGSLHRNYDLLLRNKLFVVAERHVRIEHCLLALPGVKIAEIREVYSLPIALDQCEHYLDTLTEARRVATHDTAGSARLVRDSGNRTAAAVASRRAAEVYGLEILKAGIEDNRLNFTRFLALAKQPLEHCEGDCKTSLVFQLKHGPGELYRALGVFAQHNVDLTKIESRPIVGKPWEYRFYMDFIGSPERTEVRRALDEFAHITHSYRVFGTYPRHVWNAPELAGDK